jgi:hypothetical protein
VADTDLVRPRTFRLVRTEDVTGVSGTGIVADGVAWPDGSVSVRWRGEHPSIVFWRDLEAVEAIHGHGGRTHLEWDLERVVPPDLSEVRKVLTSAQGDVLVRRLPAGPWEPAPDTPGAQKPATPPRGPSGASPSADGTAR